MANMVTFSSIVFGSLSLVTSFNGIYSWSAILILIAVVMDGLDGRIARKFGTVSEIGKELDSLCDLVSFGVAPAMLIYLMAISQTPWNFYGLAVAVFYICCGAYRLARFNVLNISTYFVGIPITLAGLLMAVLALVLVQVKVSPEAAAWFSMAFTLAMAVLMVSRFKVKKF